MQADIVGNDDRPNCTEQCNKHERVIVLEDDLILSPVALSFLNQGLNHYAENEKVMHISAYMYPVKQKLPTAFFYREATCWGWATWKRAWHHFQNDSSVILAHIKKHRLRYEFNIKDSMFFLPLLRKQSMGRIDSWAIRWYGSMFMQGGLSLHPGESLVQNCGFDGSGIHCNETDVFNVVLSEEIPDYDYPDNVEENKVAVQAMVEYRKHIHNLTLFDKFKRIVGLLLNRLNIY